MLIDWFTVGAQGLNFIILVWLLKRLLYRPILDAIDTREKRIVAQLTEAGAKKAEASAQRDEFQRKNDAFDQQRAALLTQARQEAQLERERLLGLARQAADTLSLQRQAGLQADTQQLDAEIRRRAQQEVFAIARRALTDLAAVSLEERVCDMFAHRLRSMDGSSKQSLGAGLGSVGEAPLVRSAFELPAAQRTVLQRAFNEVMATDVPLRFEVAPTLIAGIEFIGGGRKLAWNVSDYLESMERGLAKLLTERDRSGSKPQATLG